MAKIFTKFDSLFDLLLFQIGVLNIPFEVKSAFSDVVTITRGFLFFVS
jgi:hypothetical protein